MIKDKFLTPKGASLAIGKTVSRWTASRALKDIGYTSAVKKKKPALSAKNVKARFKFAREHRNWTVDDWKHVIWSDESKCNRFQPDDKQYCWRRHGEIIQRHHVKETVKHDGGNATVWGCFTWWCLGTLQRISNIMKKENYVRILQTHLPDFVDKSPYPAQEVLSSRMVTTNTPPKSLKNGLVSKIFN